MSKRRTRTANSAKRFARLPVITVASLVILAIGAVTVLSRQLNNANDHERRSAVADKPVQKRVSVKVSGQDIPVDPQTGQIRPLTKQEADQLAQGLKELIDPSAEGLKEVQQADGSVSMDLEGRFRNVTVARVNEDGSVSTSCVNNPKAAGAFFGIDPKKIEKRPKNK